VFAETRFLFFNGAMKLCLTAALLGYFVRSFDLVGAVAVNLIVGVIGRIVSLARMKQVLKVRWAEVLPWNSLGAITLFSVAAGIPAILLKDGFHTFPLVALAIAGLTYSISYGVLVLSFGLVPIPDVERIWVALRKSLSLSAATE